MFGADIQFKYQWRPYQERVLNEIEKHLSDDKLHIIAPPGSGKTVLGLEVVRRLNRPTLILSPTITIRNQWVKRFNELFAEGGFKDYSFDLRIPAGLTSGTYQSLYSLQSHKSTIPDISEEDDVVQEGGGDDNQAPMKGFDLVDVLKKREIEVLVLDEAHHLKAEWWKSLMTVVKGLGKLKIIALTATPPFDSTPAEWERYSALCGPVDAEITVPELVKEKNLCPHQDLIYQSCPTNEEFATIDRFYESVGKTAEDAVADERLVALLSRHPVLEDPDESADLIYSDIEYYASLAVFLNYKECGSLKKLLKTMGLQERNIPRFDDQWFEILLTGLFYKDGAMKGLPFVKELKKVFKQAGAMDGKRVVLSRQDGLNKLMGSSLSKFQSIREIVDFEYGQLKSDLRLVVLSDFVRKEALGKTKEMTQFGVVPILRYLYDTNELSDFDYSGKIAVLSGSLCIIPRPLESSFRELAKSRGLATGLSLQPVSSMSEFAEVRVPQSRRSDITFLMTELFTRGEINILLGTKSLLGEGWDCPAVNSLILATFVGSYMLSNQMRGRAIRTDGNNPGKTANIWHLMCRDLRHRKNDADLQLMTQRFKCFTGLDSSRDLILNGLDRTGLKFKKDLNGDNRSTKVQAADRKGLFDRWFRAIDLQQNGKIVKTVRSRKKSLKRNYVYKNTLKHLIIQSVLSSCWYTFHYLTLSFKTAGGQGETGAADFLNVLQYGALIAAAGFLFPTVKAVLLFIRHGSAASSFKQIGRVVLDTMADLGLMEDSAKATVHTDRQPDGSINCELHHASPYEQSLFLTAMEELLEAVVNPRYILTRNSGGFFASRDYHAVPAIFGVKKEKAQSFHKNWQKHMGRSSLIYTRNGEGRRELVQARSNSLAGSFVKNSEVIDSWKR